MKKILVSDYDDTFYLNDKDIKNNVELVNSNQDKFMFVIATGRSYLDYQKKERLYNIKSEYVIINHGASIIKNNQLIYNLSIDNNIKDSLIMDLELNEAINFFTCSGLDSRTNIYNNDISKINVNYGNSMIALKKYNEIRKKYDKYVNCFLISRNCAIEIVGKMANKKNAILKVIELENIKKDNVYTVGNGDTDYEMLNYFNGYAMEFSTPLIQKLNLEKLNSVSQLIEKICN